MTKASDNIFPKLIESLNTSDPAAPSDSSWKIYAKAPGIYARSSNAVVGPFGTGGTLTTKDEGSTLSTGVTTLDFVGSGVTASGAGATTTVTIAGGGGGALVLLEQHTASSSATLDFTSFISSTYDDYLFDFIDIFPATDAVSFTMRYATGGGPTYDTAADYAAANYAYSQSGVVGVGGGGLTSIPLNETATIKLSNTALWGYAGSLKLYNPQGSGYKKVDGTATYFSSRGSGEIAGTTIHGVNYSLTAALTAVRFLMSSGNITSGTIRCYGVSKT